MKFNENLQELYLSRNHLGPEDGQHLGNTLVYFSLFIVHSSIFIMLLVYFSIFLVYF